jgi:hypothetical protein
VTALVPVAERADVRRLTSEAALARHKHDAAQDALAEAEARLAEAEQAAGASWSATGALPAALTRAQREVGEARSTVRVAEIAATTSAARVTQAVDAARAAVIAEATAQASALIAELDRSLVQTVRTYAALEQLARAVVGAGAPPPVWPGPLAGVRLAGFWSITQWRHVMRQHGVLAADGQDAALAALLAPPAGPSLPVPRVPGEVSRNSSELVVGTVEMPALPNVLA